MGSRLPFLEWKDWTPYCYSSFRWRQSFTFCQLKYFSHQVTFTFQFYEDSLKYLYGACPNFFICYTKMSFGLRNASQYFSLWVRNLHNKLPFHLQKHIVTYLDDLLCHSPTLEQHFQILNELVVILKLAGSSWTLQNVNSSKHVWIT